MRVHFFCTSLSLSLSLALAEPCFTSVAAAAAAATQRRRNGAVAGIALWHLWLNSRSSSIASRRSAGTMSQQTKMPLTKQQQQQQKQPKQEPKQEAKQQQVTAAEAAHSKPAVNSSSSSPSSSASASARQRTQTIGEADIDQSVLNGVDGGSSYHGFKRELGHR